MLLALAIRTFVGLAFYIPSSSMEKTLLVNDRLVVSRLSYRLHDPNRGDIVVFDNPTKNSPRESPPRRLVNSLLEVVGFHQDKDKSLIKRVVALPGETIDIRDGRVWINGRALIEPYLADGVQSYPAPPGTEQTQPLLPLTLGPDQYFMMGDNRGNSSDSRYIGPINRDAFVGRAVVRVWPPTRLDFL